MAQKPEGAVAVFVLGLLGLLMCAPLGIFAWVMGNSYLAKCRAMSVQPDGLAVAGRILGIIATILLILSVVIWGLVICAGVFAAGSAQ
jgi:hypothetical protein